MQCSTVPCSAVQAVPAISLRGSAVIASNTGTWLPVDRFRFLVSSSFLRHASAYML
ncbi:MULTISPECIES: hypothetical protein [Paenibacillus]|uniref:Uncharacterized protein n=1 Tax=Paenibacillus campinasensis TaxID=66347 RepID=A0ABW9T0X7_9BACL|nr:MULTISPECIES: hypothetical protein [Paenibacillus]MUG65825.1 hypothetical protein [Paenibacillus campinasensis]